MLWIALSCTTRDTNKLDKITFKRPEETRWLWNKSKRFNTLLLFVIYYFQLLISLFIFFYGTHERLKLNQIHPKTEQYSGNTDLDELKSDLTPMYKFHTVVMLAYTTYSPRTPL